jgi:hypothetical protein
MCVVVVSASLCISCSTSENDVIFSDDFESYTDAWPTWTPSAESGWVNVSTGEIGGDGVVAIWVDDGRSSSPRFVRHDSGGWLLMINDDATGTDYTLSMNIKHGANVGGVGIIGRYNDLNNYYRLQINGGDTLALYKMHGGVYEQVGDSAAISYDFNTTLYQIEMTFSGNAITGRFGDASVTYTDDGATYGPVITSGKIGFGGDESSYGYYDDVLMTAE